MLKKEIKVAKNLYSSGQISLAYQCYSRIYKRIPRLDIESRLQILETMANIARQRGQKSLELELLKDLFYLSKRFGKLTVEFHAKAKIGLSMLEQGMVRETKNWMLETQSEEGINMEGFIKKIRKNFFAKYLVQLKGVENRKEVIMKFYLLLARYVRLSGKTKLASKNVHLGLNIARKSKRPIGDYMIKVFLLEEAYIRRDRGNILGAETILNSYEFEKGINRYQEIEFFGKELLIDILLKKGEMGRALKKRQALIEGLEEGYVSVDFIRTSLGYVYQLIHLNQIDAASLALSWITSQTQELNREEFESEIHLISKLLKLKRSSLAMDQHLLSHGSFRSRSQPKTSDHQPDSSDFNSRGIYERKDLY